MDRQELSVRKKRGRPSGRVRPPTAPLRLPLELLERVDLWAISEKDNPSRPEAIRRLLEKALTLVSDFKSLSGPGSGRKAWSTPPVSLFDGENDKKAE